MIHVIIENEFIEGPLWYRDSDWDLFDTPPKVIKRDKIVNDLAEKMCDMYSSYFEFNSHDMAVWFNEEQQKKDVPIMLDLVAQLKSRLEEINDGSYEVLDYETEKLLRLQAGGDYIIPKN